MAETKTKSRRLGTVDTETARKIWLAGVGAYGRAFDVAREQFDKINNDAAEYFEELVQRGEKLEGQVQEQFEGNDPAQRLIKGAEKVSARTQKVAEQQREFIDSRIADLQHTLDMPMGILGLSRKVRDLIHDVEELKHEVKELKKAKAPAKKATTKKKVAKKTAAK